MERLAESVGILTEGGDGPSQEAHGQELGVRGIHGGDDPHQSGGLQHPEHGVGVQFPLETSRPGPVTKPVRKMRPGNPSAKYLPGLCLMTAVGLCPGSSTYHAWRSRRPRRRAAGDEKGVDPGPRRHRRYGFMTPPRDIGENSHQDSASTLPMIILVNTPRVSKSKRSAMDTSIPRSRES